MQKLKIKERIKDFLHKDTTIRRIRNFLNTKFFPYFRKVFLLFLALLIIIFIGLKIFKPLYLNKIYAKLSNYSFHYLNLDNYDFTSINISGNNRSKKEEILLLIEKIKTDFKDKNSEESLIKILAVEIKNNQDWINKINISRTLPNHLNITISEYEPFAIWQNDGQKYVIDREGNKIRIENDDEFKDLIILSGNNANLNVKSLFNILAINPQIGAEIYSATWIGNRRWDVRFNNGLLVKLPASNFQEAWQNLIQIYSTKGSLENLISIDLRIDKKIYLEYDDKTIKEIRNFKL